jgi:hypothetical protein
MRRQFRFLIICLLVGLLLPSSAAPVQAQSSGTAGAVNWNGWSFSYEVSGNYDGLSLRNVAYNGTSLLYKVTFPVMRVFYTDNLCGPYADRIGPDALAPISWANDALLVQREFTLNGRQWLELGIRALIGNYDIYQSYYLSQDGMLDAHIFSRGLQCNADHEHYPYWRFDFEVGGVNNQLWRETASGWQLLSTEFDAAATTAVNHRWQVRNPQSGATIAVLPGFTTFTVPGDNVPVSDYSNHQLFGRLYRASEDTTWFYGALAEVPFNNSENIDSQDLVLFYKAYLAHSAAEGPDLWHSTGVRLAFLGTAGGGNPTPTPTPVPPTPTPIPTVAPTPTPTRSASACSTGGGRSTYLNFVNTTSRTVYVYWVDYNCNERFYKALSPWRSYWQQTYGNHVWRIYDGSSRLLRQVTAPNYSTTVFIR